MQLCTAGSPVHDLNMQCIVAVPQIGVFQRRQRAPPDGDAVVGSALKIDPNLRVQQRIIHDRGRNLNASACGRELIHTVRIGIDADIIAIDRTHTCTVFHAHLIKLLDIDPDDAVSAGDIEIAVCP